MTMIEEWGNKSPDYPEETKVKDFTQGRIDSEELMIEMARLMAKRSSCGRLQVGAVIASLGRIISTGYNGAPSRMDHCNSDICDLTAVCTRAVHAEANAIAFAARHGIKTDRSIMYCTDSPCLECAKLVINAGIAAFIYAREYRNTQPIHLLEDAGVIVRRYGIDA